MRQQETCSEATLHFMTASRILGQLGQAGARKILELLNHEEQETMTEIRPITIVERASTQALME